MIPISFADVQHAQRRLKGVAHVTPVLTSQYLDASSRSKVFLKCENFQRVGAFKFRGAYNAISQLSLSKNLQPIVALSSGNHAQGVALACQLHGLRAHIVMPEPTNSLKLEAVRAYGATVDVVANRKEGEARVRDVVSEKDGRFVHAFNDPSVIAGQGTAALEFLEAQPELDVILAPVGGGGLLSGTCLAAHGLRPAIGIYACEPLRALDAVYSVRDNEIKIPHPADTMAEGLLTSLGDLTLAILRQHLEGFFIVEEHEIVNAMRVAFERLKIVIEPSSAVALAPLLRGEPALQGRRIGVIITGGNVDFSMFSRDLAEKSEKRNS